MKHIIYLCLSLCILPAFAQEAEPTAEEIAFDNAMQLSYEKEDYDSALLLFNHFLASYPNSSMKPRAIYNIGYLYFDSGRPDEAIPYFERLLNNKYNEFDKAGGMMKDYTLYKHRGSKYLADIYLEKEDYETAGKYIKLFDKKYKYKHFCGNEKMANRIYTDYTYGRLYHGTGKTNKAIKKMLPHLFNTGLASNQYLTDYLTEVLEEQYSSEELKTIVIEAKNSLKFDRRKNGYIKFLGKKIEVHTEGFYMLIMRTTDKEGLDEIFALNERELCERVLATHPLFDKYSTTDPSEK